jgi:hypothetical protein
VQLYIFVNLCAEAVHWTYMQHYTAPLCLSAQVLAHSCRACAASVHSLITPSHSFLGVCCHVLDIVLPFAVQVMADPAERVLRQCIATPLLRSTSI